MNLPNDLILYEICPKLLEIDRQIIRLSCRHLRDLIPKISINFNRTDIEPIHVDKFIRLRNLNSIYYLMPGYDEYFKTILRTVVDIASVSGYAARIGKLTCLEYIVNNTDYKFDMNTAACAVAGTHHACLQYILSLQSVRDINNIYIDLESNRYKNIVKSDCSSECIMTLAIKRDDVRSIEILSESGLIFQPTEYINFAAVSGSLNCLQYFRRSGYDISAHRYLAGAASKGHLECLELMYDTEFEYRYYPMQEGSHHLHIIKYLLHIGGDLADINVDICIRYNNLEVVKFLNFSGYEFTHQDLITAIVHNRYKCVKLIHKKIQKYDTIYIDIAYEYKRYDIFVYLYRAGCEISPSSATYQTIFNDPGSDFCEFLLEN